MNALSLVEKIACLPSQDKAQVEWLVDRFLAHSLPKKGCDCHVVDPRKSNILVWPSKNPKCPDSLVVKFADQRFIGLPRADKKGEKYWKVRDFYENEEKEPDIAQTSPSVSPETNPAINKPLSLYSKAEIDRIAKFQARQTQAQPKEPKSMSGEEYLAQLARERSPEPFDKGLKKAQVQKEETQENASNSTTPSG